MNCARINCAHDDPAVWTAMISNIRAVSRHLRVDCHILMDVAGQKARIETAHVSNNSRPHRGDRMVFVKDFREAGASDTAIATVSLPEILESLRPGAEVWIDDGKIGARVLSNHPGRVVLEITSARSKGQRLRAEKGDQFSKYGARAVSAWTSRPQGSGLYRSPCRSGRLLLCSAPGRHSVARTRTQWPP